MDTPTVTIRKVTGPWHGGFVNQSRWYVDVRYTTMARRYGPYPSRAVADVAAARATKMWGVRL